MNKQIAEGAGPAFALIEAEVLLKAVTHVGRELGLTLEILSEILGNGPEARNLDGIEPKSKAGQQAIRLIRCYCALYGLVGGDLQTMVYWMHAENLQTQGIPLEQMKTEPGLATVLAYLEGMRNH